jgi:hypothetical protein
MLKFKDLFSNGEYYIIAAFTLALDYDDYSYLVKAYGERGAFEYIREARNYKNYFASTHNSQVWTLILNNNGYLEEPYHVISAAISVGLTEMPFLQKTYESHCPKYDSDWAKLTFSDLDRLEEEYSKILKKLF